MKYAHIRDNKAFDAISEMFSRGLNATVIAWHLNNRKPFIEPPYRAKEWTAVLVNNVYNSR